MWCIRTQHRKLLVCGTPHPVHMSSPIPANPAAFRKAKIDNNRSCDAARPNPKLCVPLTGSKMRCCCCGGSVEYSGSTLMGPTLLPICCTSLVTLRQASSISSSPVRNTKTSPAHQHINSTPSQESSTTSRMAPPPHSACHCGSVMTTNVVSPQTRSTAAGFNQTGALVPLTYIHVLKHAATIQMATAQRRFKGPAPQHLLAGCAHR